MKEFSWDQSFVGSDVQMPVLPSSIEKLMLHGLVCHLSDVLPLDENGNGYENLQSLEVGGLVCWKICNRGMCIARNTHTVKYGE